MIWTLIFSFLGITAIIISLRSLMRDLGLKKIGVQTEGKVIGPVGASLRRSLQIEFTDQSGHGHTIASRAMYHDSRMKKLVGTHVKIIYDPKYPSTNMIDSWQEMWGSAWLGLIVGLLFIAMGIFVRTNGG